MSANGVCLQGDMGDRGFLGPPGIEGAKVSVVAGPGRNAACWEIMDFVFPGREGGSGFSRTSRRGEFVWLFPMTLESKIKSHLVKKAVVL